jgi:hypothetical protein
MQINSVTKVPFAMRLFGLMAMRNLTQLPMQPLLAALAVSFVLGAVPMMLTAIYAVARVVLDWCRYAARLRRDEPVIGTRSGLINHLELL